MGQPLTKLQQDLVEEFGRIYEAYGLKRLTGLIVGLLLNQREPVSLDDIVEHLNRSKGPISQAVRELADAGLIRKVNGPENRRDYYEAHPDIFYNNFKFNMATVRKNRRTAEQFLREMKESDEVAHQGSIGNLEHMMAFYSLMEAFYERFSVEWEQQRLALIARAIDEGRAAPEAD
jgi:HTH-type transcriptional regulator, glycine betaine synthesis regulator